MRTLSDGQCPFSIIEESEEVLFLDFKFDIIINAFPLLIEGAIFTIQIYST